jgi:hypothetical protein
VGGVAAHSTSDCRAVHTMLRPMTHMDDERVRAEHSPRTEAEQALESLKGDRAAQLSAPHEGALSVPRLANRLPAPADRTADSMAAALDEMAGRLLPSCESSSPR